MGKRCSLWAGVLFGLGYLALMGALALIEYLVR